MINRGREKYIRSKMTLRASLHIYICFCICILVGCLSVIPIQAASISIDDELGVLTDNEEASIEELGQAMYGETGIEPAIVMTDTMNGKTSNTYADDYNDTYVADADGIVLLVNMEDREVWISTKGDAKTIYASSVDTMLDEIAPNLTSGDYMTAAKTFIELAQEYAETYEASSSLATASSSTASGYSSRNSSQSASSRETTRTYWSRVKSNMSLWIFYVIALLIAGVATYLITAASRGKVTTTTRTYESADSFELTEKRDQFMHETITKHRIPKNNGRGGPGGGPGGGGGHGGGGRGF